MKNTNQVNPNIAIDDARRLLQIQENEKRNYYCIIWKLNTIGHLTASI